MLTILFFVALVELTPTLAIPSIRSFLRTAQDDDPTHSHDVASHKTMKIGSSRLRDPADRSSSSEEESSSGSLSSDETASATTTEAPTTTTEPRSCADDIVIPSTECQDCQNVTASCGQTISGNNTLIRAPIGGLFCDVPFRNGVTIEGDNNVVDCQGATIDGGGSGDAGFEFNGDNNALINCCIVGFNQGAHVLTGSLYQMLMQATPVRVRV